MPRAGAARDARPQPTPTDPPPPSHQHQALFAAVRSGDAATVRALLADAEASGASLAALAGEAATYVAAGAEREEVVRLILSLYEFKAAAISARVDLDTFNLVAMRGWVGKPPSFDGTDYAAWKYRMKIYLTAIHPSVWWIVETGYTVKGIGNRTTKEEQNEHKNALAAGTIHSALSPNERNKIYGLESAKEIWDTLQLAHEGTPRVRKLKIELLMGKLERFVMEEGETPEEMYNRLILIVNEIKGLGSKEMTDNFVVRRMLRAINPRYPILATSIHWQDDFAQLTPYYVLGRIQDLVNQSSSSKKKCLTPKPRKEAKESSSEEESDDQQEEDDMELFSKRLNEIFKRQGKSKKRHSKRPCYECGEIGHFMFNCPNKKNKENDEKKKENHNKKNNKSKSHKKSQKVQAHTGKEWDSNDSSTDSDDEGCKVNGAFSLGHFQLRFGL
ncbi:hypothetical protein C2845_PM11G26420 [Panicum miliaceum]|uniref:CCHC-type domain-containing protein n=1 Tax=Panicum miliaceum TaxID=4540 RepID=A0A3L6RW09_PANMI|nr:hypothetical protein C2845_PM11G26420 [Panicum miliaceum]